MSPVELAIVRERRFKTLFFLLSLVAGYFLVVKVENMLVSTILAVSFYYLMAPIVDQIERRGVSRTWATTIPFLSFGVLFFFLVAWASPLLWQQAVNLQANSDKYIEALNSSIASLQSRFNESFSFADGFDVKAKIVPQILALSSDFFKNLPQILSQSATVLFLAPLLSFFMLLDGRDFFRKWLSLVPNHIFELTLNLNDQITSQIGGFIRARLIESLFVSAFTWFGLLAMDFQYALILALVAGVLNIIPYIGPLVALAPALTISLANGGGTSELLLLLALYGLVQILDTVILVPFLVAKIVNLHPVTVLVAIIAGAQLMGLMGMIICIPVVSALKVTSLAIYRHLTDFRT